MHSDHHAKRVERLREVQPQMSEVGWPQVCRQRICRNLQRGESAGENEQGGEDWPEAIGVGADDDEKAARGT